MDDPKTFQCALCGGMFEKGKSDEEAMRESEEHFGKVPKEELAIVCDDCWNRVHPQRN